MTKTTFIHRLSCKTQCYDWGKIGMDSKVAQLAQSDINFKIDNSAPYSELWMGTHPNGPSYLFEQDEPLDSILDDTNLSENVFREFNGELPFLFKVLSIRKALSIQVHPDMKTAKQLHEKSPYMYKDGNHKPEMAIAITPFEAFIGFRPLKEIVFHLKSILELRNLLSGDFCSRFENGISDNENSNKLLLKQLFSKLLEQDPSKVQTALSNLIERITDENIDTELEDICEIVQRLNQQFPGDIGCFIAFFLNYVKLEPGQGIFLAANEPHAYISGDCVECMAASDNVIRAGLTPKYKDVDTLISCLTYNYGSVDKLIINGVKYKNSKNTLIYKPPIREFAILRTELSFGAKERIQEIAGPSIMICTEGNGEFYTAGGDKYPLETGYVYFIGSCQSLTLTCKSDLKVFTAFCEI